MLHAGADPVECGVLCQLKTPAVKATHMPIPHYRVVDLIAHSLGYSVCATATTAAFPSA
jgi:hypothetical protein